MSENQARLARDLYDYEHDEPRSSGSRRRRPVADWGVGDDVFDHMPRNRFSRVTEAPRPHRFASGSESAGRAVAERGHTEHDAMAGAEVEGQAADATDRQKRTIVADWLTEEDEQAIAGVDQYEVGAERRESESSEDAGDQLSDRDGTPARRTAPRGDGQVPRGRVDDGRRTIVIGRPEDVPSEIAAIAADRDIPDDPPPAVQAAAPGERRTIRIGGRPEGSLEATRAQRRRPPRTAHERIGARPDRVAAYAVALGLLLILIAVISAL